MGFYITPKPYYLGNLLSLNRLSIFLFTSNFTPCMFGITMGMSESESQYNDTKHRYLYFEF